MTLLVVLFFGAVLGEEWLRARQVVELNIIGLPIEGVKMRAMHKPDFLWSGRAWWIDIDNDKPLLITLDDKWSARIPVGVHKIYSNHDHTNTGQYGDANFYGFPKSVSVQEAVP